MWPLSRHPSQKLVVCRFALSMSTVVNTTIWDVLDTWNLKDLTKILKGADRKVGILEVFKEYSVFRKMRLTSLLTDNVYIKASENCMKGSRCVFGSVVGMEALPFGNLSGTSYSENDFTWCDANTGIPTQFHAECSLSPASIPPHFWVQALFQWWCSYPALAIRDILLFIVHDASLVYLISALQVSPLKIEASSFPEFFGEVSEFLLWNECIP